MTDTLQVLIADDHPLFRNALSEALSNTGTPITIEQTDTLESTLFHLENNATDLLLLDLKMPGSEGLLGLIQIRTRFPEVALAVITANEASRTVAHVKAAGALGYLPKSLSLEQLVDALRALISGKGYFPANHQADSHNIDEDIDAITKLASLTPKQQHVLALIARGYLNKQIAYELSVKETTIKTHVSEIFRKLNLYNRTQAAMYNQYLEVPE
ncbi:MAG: response regulator transcription factor [Saccharospirillum sp.]|uniref:response regulator transcription factor n=1 Tax=Saccharospirillum TaxID=231683 RepID=UPI003299FBB4